MKPVFTFFLGMFAVSETILLWVILFSGSVLGFLPSTVTALLVGGLTFFGIKLYSDRKFLKKNKLTRKEYVYIQKNLAEAKKKISRLQKAFFSVRTMGAFKQLYELSRLSKRMYTIINKEPRRFYQSERFFFYHLDSVVELSERYALLASQPVKNEKMYISLKEAQSTLEDLSESIKKDIYRVLSADIDDLNFELDVAKHSLKKLEYNPLEDERRTK
ncbi:5-bromo-4-chloroindolyl phosphate hydrolysis family protein [Lederbergia wuyishanensis]|uniref:5-bromo-4-chloroindolyl phosphate hydrolysis protein n=1 Tax=Lederbergia wuyishanensis TaxID=1347903 RepID=A0ABU0D145_9BACI|nr:5-bromo-4-chloroindolyl phosphate hydrolysis family protein [Lederbergia wuyishanensis]MCJ8006745.1 5-bromo-4-chloroindolyl phosphate hydrolysis family protein [Lederbergia wuyishanensis]MDQ0342127.1 5-bromo-4-chloroindolyl phosphate hydrolysis protein [Lederbergia wuyishanensis]